MPRKKSWRKIDEATIKEKNCLQVELMLQEPLTPWQVHTLRTYCKFTIGEDLQQISIITRNSWKGLIMACLSITYCKYGNEIVSHLIKSQQFLNTQVGFDYEEMVQLYHSKNDIVIEQVATPPSWKPCYIVGRFTTNKIYSSFRCIENLLGLDISKCLIKTSDSNVPHIFKNNPVHLPVQTKRWRASDFICCVEGIAFVTEDVISKLFGNCYAVCVSYDLKPQQLAEWSSNFDDYGNPAPLFGYEVYKQSQEHLSEYFPFLKDYFINEVSRTGSSTYVLFDRKHLGKWG